MSQRRAFTLLELLVLVVVLAGLAALVVIPILFQVRVGALPMESNIRMRGIHEGMVQYSNGNNQWFPGLDHAGNVTEATTNGRLLLLLEKKFFDAEYVLSPMEDGRLWNGESALDPDQYSYALYQIDHPVADAGRIAESQFKTNSQAAIVSDRNTDNSGGYSSVKSELLDQTGWRGGVAWNDGHTTFENSHLIPRTRYADGPVHKDDNLFVAAGPDDAKMVFYRTEWNPPRRSTSGVPGWFLYTLISLLILTCGLLGGVGLTLLYRRRGGPTRAGAP